MNVAALEFELAYIHNLSVLEISKFEELRCGSVCVVLANSAPRYWFPDRNFVRLGGISLIGRKENIS